MFDKGRCTSTTCFYKIVLRVDEENSYLIISALGGRSTGRSPFGHWPCLHRWHLLNRAYLYSPEEAWIACKAFSCLILPAKHRLHSESSRLRTLWCARMQCMKWLMTKQPRQEDCKMYLQHPSTTIYTSALNCYNLLPLAHCGIQVNEVNAEAE